MKRAFFWRRRTFIAIAIAALTLSHAQAIDYAGNGIVRSPDGRPCTFFQLSGVAVADPVVPASPWFVIPQSAVGYKEMLAMLMTAKITGAKIYVTTTGTVNAARGQAEVSVIHLP